MNAVDLLLLFPNNRPRAYGSLGTDIAAVTPPVQLGLLAAYARQQGLAGDLLDADGEGIRPDQGAGGVGESVPALVIVGTVKVNSGDVT